MTSTSTVDAWTATCHSRIQAIQAGILDVIDIGVPVDVYPTLRVPTRKEQDATDRKDGMFRSTPVGGSRGSGVSRPTERPLISWEEASQRATTPLWELAGQVQRSLVTEFALHPIDEYGNPLELAPAATRTIDATYTRPAHHVIDLSPAGCRLWTLEAIGWLGAVTDAMGEAWLKAGEDGEGRVRGHANWFVSAVTALAKRYGSYRKCACGCGQEAPPQGQGATRSGCRSRLQRERKAS